MQHIARKIITFLGSIKFFYIVIAVLVIGAGWMALTASYPMAFDESFHLGIIQIYAHQWSPILTATPPNSGSFGELTHDPSYLYHYLMSFPYRLIDHFTHNFVVEAVFMRFLNIGLFVIGLIAFQKLLIRIGVSAALTHFSLLMLVLLPVTPFLAAHINYDNMLFMLVPMNLLLAYTCIDAITKKGVLPAKNLMILLSIGALTCLVKYVFLPIFVTIIIYLLVVWLRNRNRKAIADSIWTSFKKLGLPIKLSLVILFIVSSGLFLQRYGVNVVEYGNVQPDCSKVEGLESCLQYGPWARNYYLQAQAQSPESIPDPVSTLFLPYWFGGLVYRLYFAINYDFHEYAPMPLPITMSVVIAVSGMVLTIIFWRSILRINRHIWLLVAIILAYALSLLYVNYTEYLRFDTMVAINGRYFIPLLPFIFVIIGLAYRRLITVIMPRRIIVAKTSLAVVAILVALQGGGVLTYLVHSEPVWYWKGDPLTSFNVTAQNIATHLIIGAKK
jgi:hypothetical protein